MQLQPSRNRGITSAKAQVQADAVLNQLTDAFEEFKANNNREIDDINKRLSASKIGPDGSNSKASPIAGFTFLGDYAKNGARAAMEVGHDPSGGYLVQPDVEKQITLQQRDISPMRRIARVVTTTSGEYKIPMAAEGVESGWVSEKEARPNTGSPKLAMVSYTVHEVYANPAITQTLLEDASVSVGEFLAKEISDAFTDKEGAAFISGDGVKQPRGLLSYESTTEADGERALGKLQHLVTAGAAIAPDDLIDLVFKLRAGYRTGAVWLMNSATAALVRKLKDADGNHIWSVSSQPGVLPSLLGYPVEFDEGMPSVSANSTPIAFGNFQRGYLIVDRRGIRLLRDEVTNKPFVQFYTTKRVGGGLYDGNAIKLLKIKGA